MGPWWEALGITREQAEALASNADEVFGESADAPHPLDYNPSSAEDPDYLAVTAVHNIHDRSRYNDGTNDDEEVSE